MKETKNKVSPGAKDTKQKITKPVKEKVDHMEATMTKLKLATMKKLVDLADNIEVVPRKRYVGYKLKGRLLSSIMGMKSYFDMSIHEYSKDGAHVGTKHFKIEFGRKDVSAFIAGLVKQVKKNYDILTEANKPKKKVAKKTEPKKESFEEAKIVEEVPIKEATKETKKEA